MKNYLSNHNQRLVEAARDASPWLTREEAAARAKVGRNTIERWVESGKLKAHKIVRDGRTRGIVRFKKSELDALLEGGA
jgi:excisionase family DNA binding protein